MHFVDCHFHLDLMENPSGCVADIEKSGIYTIAVTNSPKVFFYTHGLASNKKYLRAALGLHPELAFQRQNEIQLFLQELPKTRYIGEVGLDNYRKKKDDYEIQKKVFEKILDACAAYNNKIITVHSRWSVRDVISMIGNNYSNKVILHWFSGTLNELKLAIDAGFYFSINLAMTSSDNGKKIIEMLPTERILTESDGPFVQFRGQTITPLDIEDTVKEIALIRSEPDHTKLRELIFSNFKSVIRYGI